MSEATAPAAGDAAEKGGDKKAAKGKGGGMLTKLVALVFMLLVVVTECLVGYMWFFSPSDGAASATESVAEAEGGHGDADAQGEKAHTGKEHGEKSHGEKAHGEAGHASKGHGDSGHGGSSHAGSGHGGHGKEGEEGKPRSQPLGDYVEVDLGKYSVMAFQPGANAMRVIEFHLYGTIASEDHDAFERLWEENQQRCRDQVIVTIRSSDVEDFTDPGLGLIKRKILARTNDVLGKPLIEEVVFSEFSFIEE